MKTELLKRLKSFGWRLLGMSLVALLAFVSSNLELFNLSPAIIGLVGLVINEITKQLNNTFSLEGKMLGGIRKIIGK